MTDMKENETIEFKKSLAELKAGLASISAILNKHTYRNAPDVEFREVAGIFITGFERPSSTEEKNAAIEETIKKKAGTIDKTIDRELPSTERPILDLIVSNPTVTQKEMAARLNLSEIGIRYNTDKLKAKGFLRRTGGKKDGRWEILRDE